MQKHGEFIGIYIVEPEVASIGGWPEEGYSAILADGKGGEFIIDDCFDTPEEAKQAAENYQQEYYSSDLIWSAESRMQAGMGLGIDAYNDFY